MIPIANRLNHHTDKRLERVQFVKMAADAFSFCRGTCRVFYEDLKADPDAAFLDSPLVWISGDLHPANFGTFKGSTGAIYFDINDFDESTLAPALWELVRLAASMIVLCRCMHHKDIDGHELARKCLERYGSVLSSGKALYVSAETKNDPAIDRLFKSAREISEAELIDKATVRGDAGALRLKLDKDQADERITDEALEASLLRAMEQRILDPKLPGLAKYAVTDVIFRVAGTGSIGGLRYLFLLRHRGDSDKYLLLDMKEAVASKIPDLVPGEASRPTWSSNAERIILVQQRMQAVNPPILFAMDFSGKHFVVQQRQPEKQKIEFDELGPEAFGEVAACLGRVTAYAQLRSAGRQGAASVEELMRFAGEQSAWCDRTLSLARRLADATAEYTEQFRCAYPEIAEEADREREKKRKG